MIIPSGIIELLIFGATILIGYHDCLSVSNKTECDNDATCWRHKYGITWIDWNDDHNMPEDAFQFDYACGSLYVALPPLVRYNSFANETLLHHPKVNDTTECDRLTLTGIIQPRIREHTLKSGDSFVSLSWTESRIMVIEKVPPLLNLRSISFAGNDVRIVARSAFDSIKDRIRSIDLAHNRLTYLHPHLFNEMLLLRVLRLDDNRFVDIPDLPPIPTLIRLHMSANRINVVRSKAFHSNRQLRLIQLDGNNVSAVAADALAATKNSSSSALKIFSLRMNRHLAELPDGFFDRTPALRRLDLSANSIRRLKYGTFAKMPLLTYLNLADNPLGRVRGSMPTGLFERNRSLKYLILKRTGLKQLTIGQLLPLTRLTVLDISENPSLLSLPDTMFHYLPHLIALNADGCRIGEIPSSVRALKSAYQSMNFRNNPIVCDTGRFDRLEDWLRQRNGRSKLTVDCVQIVAKGTDTADRIKFSVILMILMYFVWNAYHYVRNLIEYPSPLLTEEELKLFIEYKGKIDASGTIHDMTESAAIIAFVSPLLLQNLKTIRGEIVFKATVASNYAKQFLRYTRNQFFRHKRRRIYHHGNLRKTRNASVLLMFLTLENAITKIVSLLDVYEKPNRFLMGFMEKNRYIVNDFKKQRLLKAFKKFSDGLPMCNVLNTRLEKKKNELLRQRLQRMVIDIRQLFNQLQKEIFTLADVDDIMPNESPPIERLTPITLNGILPYINEIEASVERLG